MKGGPSDPCAHQLSRQLHTVLLSHTKSDHHPISIHINIPNAQQTGKRWILSPNTPVSPTVHAYIESLLVRCLPLVNSPADWTAVKDKIVLFNASGAALRVGGHMGRKVLKALCSDCPDALAIVNAQIEAVIHSRHALPASASILSVFGREVPGRFRSMSMKISNDDKFIKSLRVSPTSTPVTEQAAKEAIVADFYEHLMARKPDSAAEHQAMLDIWMIPDSVKNSFPRDPFSMKELLDAINSTNPDKSPGPDGITSDHGHFYRAHATKVAPVLLNAFNYALEHPDSVPTSLKKGFIVTIHKKGGREDIANYRP
eukprot:gene8020-9422_t